MKYFNLATVIILSLATFNFTFAHGESGRGGMGMMGGSTMGHCMMGYDMMADAECPMMMGAAMSADHLLSYRDELDLSKTQILKLKEIRENNQEEAAILRADLNAAMSELHDLLSEDELKSPKIKAANKRVEKLKSELRSKNIETYTSAKLLLTEKQLKKMQDMGIFDMNHIHGSQGMMMR